jgi:hypothetical protein
MIADCRFPTAQCRPGRFDRSGDSVIGNLQSATSARRAFTFIELCLGLVVTSLVMAAVAAFTLAVSTSWRHSDQAQTTAAHARQMSARLARLVQDARLIGAVQAGAIDGTPPAPAAALLWVDDTNGDGAIQGAECAMVEHDPVAKVIHVYAAGQGDAAIVLNWATFTAPAVLTNFKVGRTARPVVRDVAGARFAAYAKTSATQSPTLEYTVKLNARGANPGAVGADDQTILEYGTVAVRAPARQPA